MYRAAASRVRALKGRDGSRALTRFASSSVAATKSSPGGLFSWLNGDKSNSLTPLDFPLKDVTLPPWLPDHVESGKTKVTTLRNGLRIASETSASPAASIGLYVDSGSIYETPVSLGATYLLEKMAFKSTLNRSHLRLVREVEAIGGNVTAAASREQMCYTFDALKTYVPQMVELLVDAVRNPAFLDWEIKDELHKMKGEIDDYSRNPQALLLEAIHTAGYTGPLSNPLMANESSINRLDSTILEEFVAVTHFALAFEVPGGWHKEKDAMTLTVLQTLMGGGGSFSAGGPGKGMYSRLYLRVLNQYPQIQAFSAFNFIYNNTGLFGIQATTTSDFSLKAIDIAVEELTAIANPREVDQVQLERAKVSTKSAILMNLESRMVASEDIGRQILTYGERKPVEHFLKGIDEVTAKDISSLAQKLLSSPLTMASYGDVLYLPSYDVVSKKFHSNDM